MHVRTQIEAFHLQKRRQADALQTLRDEGWPLRMATYQGLIALIDETGQVT
jgi:hypothetical protein